MMTTQKMAVLKFELFMPSPYTWGNTKLEKPTHKFGRYSEPN
jgi:hypothetical protein